MLARPCLHRLQLVDEVHSHLVFLVEFVDGVDLSPDLLQWLRALEHRLAHVPGLTRLCLSILDFIIRLDLLWLYGRRIILLNSRLH